MKFEPSAIPGCVEIVPDVRADSRGSFVKTVHRELFEQHGLRADFDESYFSVSRKNVIRGLHFQRPPADHAKLVVCLEGTVLDAVVDLRRGSPTYGKHVTFRLDAAHPRMIYVPLGAAHGFRVLGRSATLLYYVTAVYAPEHDAGVHWDSAGISWETDDPEVSERDAALPTLEAFDTPFRYR